MDMKKIEIGEDYIWEGADVKVKVLHQDVNSDGDVIYACKRYSDNRLLWIGECDLEEVALNKLTPLQEDFLASEKKFINIIACGKGAGTTTAFFENILKSGNSRINFVYSINYKASKACFESFIKFCRDRNVKVMVNINNLKVILPDHRVVSFMMSVCFINIEGDHYFESGWESALTCKVILTHDSVYYFSSLPSDIISGYSTTTENGYYEVKSCKHPLLKYIINETGKIPKATPNNIEQFLKSKTNLITGYNAYNNSFLPEEFADTINDLPYSEERRLSGSWTKL